MSQSNGNGHVRPMIPLNHPNVIARNEVRKGIRAILRQALSLKDLAYETAMKQREQFGSEEEAERCKQEAQSVTALLKGFAEMVQVIRITLGKPGPGVIRRPTLQPKPRPKARRLVVLAEPGQADCVNPPLADTTSPTKPLTDGSTSSQLPAA